MLVLLDGLTSPELILLAVTCAFEGATGDFARERILDERIG